MKDQKFKISKEITKMSAFYEVNRTNFCDKTMVLIPIMAGDQTGKDESGM